jgi:hypothetical protein
MILYDYHLPYWYTYRDQNPAVQQLAIQIFWSFFWSLGSLGISGWVSKDELSCVGMKI